MAKQRPSQINARVVARALAEAEKQLLRPPGSTTRPVYEHVLPKDIWVRPELFQPRRFSQGLREVDPKHVKDLMTRITRKGELDPILVVKLGGPNAWVCVDGHHRLAAYKKLRWKGTIKCEWFSGTVREATDASLARNEVAKLAVTKADRFEEAWRRTLNGWGSKSNVVTTTGTSDGMVAMMRRVKAAYDDKKNAEGKALRAKVHSLHDASWSLVRSIWVDLTPMEWSIEAEAAKLALVLSKRLTNKLSKNPEVTARALWIYDPDLCGDLAGALAELVRRKGLEERELEGQAHLDG